jgi:hypothetical protein
VATSSASPDDLDKFVSQAGSATNELSQSVSPVVSEYDAFWNAGYEVARVDARALLHQNLTDFINANQNDEQFVSVVSKKFREADSNTLDDATIQSALQSEGASIAPRQALTIDEPTVSGLPINSGFSDDPVCTATGHLVDVERDLEIPVLLGPMAWTRVFNSRWIVDGPFGPGWSSWASTTLARRGEAIEYRGPDGQTATWVPDPDGEVATGVGARLESDQDVLVLRWSLHSRHPGETWTFDLDGTVAEVRPPMGEPIAFIYEAGRLVALAHPAGRRSRSSGRPGGSSPPSRPTAAGWHTATVMGVSSTSSGPRVRASTSPMRPAGCSKCWTPTGSGSCETNSTRRGVCWFRSRLSGDSPATATKGTWSRQSAMTKAAQ